jgi:hypothetical protein
VSEVLFDLDLQSLKALETPEFVLDWGDKVGVIVGSGLGALFQRHGVAERVGETLRSDEVEDPVEWRRLIQGERGMPDDLAGEPLNCL